MDHEVRVCCANADNYSDVCSPPFNQTELKKGKTTTKNIAPRIIQLNKKIGRDLKKRGVLGPKCILKCVSFKTKLVNYLPNLSTLSCLVCDGRDHTEVHSRPRNNFNYRHFSTA